MFGFKSKKDKIIEKQEQLINELKEQLSKQKRETVTHLNVPENEVYLSNMSHFYHDENAKWFFHQTERNIISKMKETKEYEFFNGMLNAIDLIRVSLQDLDTEYQKMRLKNG
jgi:hypothetical protein